MKTTKQTIIPYVVQFLKEAPITNDASTKTQTVTTTYNTDKDGDQD